MHMSSAPVIQPGAASTTNFNALATGAHAGNRSGISSSHISNKGATPGERLLDRSATGSLVFTDFDNQRACLTIKNTTSENVNLLGHYITNTHDPKFTLKLPDRTLVPGQTVRVVFGSSANSADLSEG